MPFIPFPDVPAFPGVPLLPRPAGYTGVVVTSVLAVAEGALWSALQTDTRWGIFGANGKALANPSQLSSVVGVLVNSVGLGSTLSTVSVDYSKGTQLSDFPIERGSFAQYNKVETPGSAAVVFGFTGSEAERNQFLNALDTATKSVDLFDVVTPEVTYVQYSIESYSYQRRAEKGATLLIVQLQLQEIRQVSAQYVSTKASQATAPASPNATPQVNSGKVQALSPVASALSAVASKIQTLATTAIQQAKGALQ